MSDATQATQVTPDSLALRRRMALALLQQGADTSPVRAWSQGLARLAQGAIGGYENAAADKEQNAAREASIRDFTAALGGGVPSAAGGGVPGAAASVVPGGPTMAQVAGTEDTVPLPQRNPLGALNPEFRSKFADLRTAAGDQGAYFDAPQQGSLGNVRSPQQQLALYAQGRTAPGPVVTGTTNSNHITGKALDVVPKEGASEKQIGSVVSALVANDPRFAGMRSGATFSNLYDPLHVELNKPQGNPQVASLDPNAGAPQQPPPAQVPAGPQMAQAQPQQVAPQPQPQQQQINPALIRALSSQFLPPAMGQIAAGQINQQLTPPELKMTTDMMGNQIPNTWDARRQLWNGRPLQAGSAAPGAIPDNATPEELTAAVDKQYPGAAARSEQIFNGEGGVPNARQNKIDAPAMQLLLRTHPDWSINDFKAKSEMRQGFAKTTINSPGGKLMALRNTFDHLANASDAAIEKGNMDLGLSPLSYVGNKLQSMTTAQKDLQAKLEREAVTYGGERTKFLTGSEGSEAERRAFLNSLGPDSAAPPQMAGTIEGEYVQMKSALLNQEQQVREQLGEGYLKKHPIITPEVKAAMERTEKNIDKLRGYGKQDKTAPAAAEQGGLPPGWSVKAH